MSAFNQHSTSNYHKILISVVLQCFLEYSQLFHHVKKYKVGVCICDKYLTDFKIHVFSNQCYSCYKCTIVFSLSLKLPNRETTASSVVLIFV